VRAQAQGFPDELVAPGVTVASATGAEALRVNPAGITVQRADSLRVTHVHALGARSTPLRGESVAWATQLPFGFSLALGASWVRPVSNGGSAGAFATAELGVGYTFRRDLLLGLRWRFFGAGGDALSGASALDVGALWRPSPHVMVGAVGQQVVGPEAPTQGVVRRVGAGAALRPTGTDALTLGVDVTMPWGGSAQGRAGLRVAIPYVGQARAEGLYDFETGAWRVGAGLELAWGIWRLGGGGFYDGDHGGYTATAAWDGDRNPVGLPERAVSVTVALDDTPAPRGFVRLLWRFERLRRDPAVRAVLFAPRDEVGGLAHAEELREVFARLRAAGKRVACHLTEATASTWYACAGVDRITVDPAGGVRLAGLRTARYYLGPALWNLGIRTDFVRIGDWKSAPEQFTRDGSTGPAREQEERMLDDALAHLVEGVAASRSLSAEEARAAIVGGPYTAREARARRLVDAVQSLDAAERALAAVAQATAIDYTAYTPVRSRRWTTGRAIAVLLVDGDIADGESREVPGLGLRRVGDETLVAALRAAAANPRIGAIVLRVDSPGGSALASDLIWRAVVAANRRKPVVASFGRIAASGGYYVAAGAREIVADPSSLTGSIGIFYGKADVASLLARLDVHVELSRRGERADMESVFRPYTPEERRFLADKIGEFYNLFLARVAQGRRRTPAEIDAVGEGRIWSGARAREAGLVDRLGGLMTALDRAQTLGELGDDYELLELPAEPSGILNTLARLVTDTTSAPPSLTAWVGASPEVRAPLAWLLSVHAGIGRPMALTDWPVLVP
jgi:protease-4